MQSTASQQAAAAAAVAAAGAAGTQATHAARTARPAAPRREDTKEQVCGVFSFSLTSKTKVRVYCCRS